MHSPKSYFAPLNYLLFSHIFRKKPIIAHTTIKLKDYDRYN